jgi:hypothetical protein
MKPAYYYIDYLLIMWQKFRYRKRLRKQQRELRLELRRELDAHTYAAGTANDDDVKVIAAFLTKRA